MVESRCGLLCSQCSFRESADCPGCLHTQSLFWGECPIKNCCEGREHEYCGLCPDFCCGPLKEFSYDEEHGDEGTRIEQCKKWGQKR